MSAIEQMKDLHRNPVIHPEYQLDIEDALSLIGIMESAISAMFSDMRKREDAAKPPPLTMLPQGLGVLQSLLSQEHNASDNEKPNAKPANSA